MKTFAADKYMTICQNLSIMAVQGKDLSETWGAEGKRVSAETIRKIQKECEDIGLRTAPRHIQEILANIEVGLVNTPRKLSPLLLNISSVIRAEMSSQLFSANFA